MTITGLLRNLDSFSTVTPSCVATVFVPSDCGSGNPYQDGCALHDALAGKHSTKFAPVLDVIRREVRSRGGRIQRAEHSLSEWCGTPRGRADLVATGNAQTGVVEIKVVSELPDEPRCRDAIQLGGYVRLAAHWSDQLSKTWALLVYVDLNAGRVRLFDFRGRELKSLVRAASQALEAA